MSPQIACLSRGKVTLLAFIWLFPAVRFQMSPQMACIKRGIVALIAFLWLFSTVYFQMCLQTPCMGGCKVTFIAFVWLFPSVRFQMFPQIACLRECIVTLVAFIWFNAIVRRFPICIIIFNISVHCHCVFCFPKWFCFNVLIVYFHFHFDFVCRDLWLLVTTNQLKHTFWSNHCIDGLESRMGYRNGICDGLNNKSYRKTNLPIIIEGAFWKAPSRWRCSLELFERCSVGSDWITD